MFLWAAKFNSSVVGLVVASPKITLFVYGVHNEISGT